MNDTLLIQTTQDLKEWNQRQLAYQQRLRGTRETVFGALRAVVHGQENQLRLAAFNAGERRFAAEPVQHSAFAGL